MSFHEILIAVMAAFAVAGAIDRIFGNRWGLGKEFEEGILAMGSLALAMVGIVCLAPVLASLLKPVIVPVFAFLGADPAMFAGTILACDMGGGALAVELAASHQAAMLGGVLTGSMLGATVVFTIPVAMGILEEKDRPVMAKGILCGIVTIPLGVLAGGLTAGFPIGMVLRNLIPIVIIAALIALGLWRAENAMVRGFEVFGKLVVADIGIRLIRDDYFLAKPEEAVFPHSDLSLDGDHVTLLTPGEAEDLSKAGQTIPDVAQELALRSRRLVRVLGRYSLATDGYRTYFLEGGEYPQVIQVG